MDGFARLPEQERRLYFEQTGARLGMASIDLLERVAVFKSVFFKAAWAKYEEARRGTLRLVPAKHTIGVLSRDYEEMQPMFFRDPPTFEAILEHLARIEQKINSTDR